MTQKVYALVDGNSFYASCEAVFNPSIWHQPVVVLSNNDGCVVAANPRAKALNKQLVAQKGDLGNTGFVAARGSNMMFQPYFKVKDVLQKNQTAVFSSNYELYGDMSQRMHRITKRFAAAQEIYSIDESFLDLTGMTQDLTAYGKQIKQAVHQEIHIPVAVGIASTKTLAKLANHLSKKNSDGVLDLNAISDSTLELLLSKLPVSSVWGVGRKMSEKLMADGIQTVLDLKNANPNQVRRKHSVVGQKIVRELNGEACLSFAEVRSPNQQIVCSRSFSQLVTSYKWMEQAVVDYTLRAAERMRQQGLVCGVVSVYIQTHKHKTHLAQYVNEFRVPLVYPSDNSILLVKMTKRALKQIWAEGYQYQKAGVTLIDLSEKGRLQLDLFAQNPKYSANDKSDRLMQVMDKVNKMMGRHTLYLGTAGHQNKQGWQMRREKMSGRYTTRWEELAIAYAR